jgi:hypothetical protein
VENPDIKTTTCCSKFDPATWDGKKNDWREKLFIRDSIPQIFHMPFPPMFAKKMMRMWKKAQEAGAAPELKNFLFLTYDPSPWKSELYLAVTKEVPNADNVKFTGEFLSRVFDGPYNAVPKWIKEMDTYVASQGKKAKKCYFYFTTCPKCAKIYGHNYAVVFAEVE